MRENEGEVVEKAFTSDRCSAIPEHAHAGCCVEHDWRYWRGGTWQQRAEADRLFRTCLKGRHHRVRIWLLWLGVRIGGLGLVPTSWRWGYGWDWPRSKPPHPDTSPHSEESETARYEQFLQAAIEADKKAGKRH